LTHVNFAVAACCYIHALQQGEHVVQQDFPATGDHMRISIFAMLALAFLFGGCASTDTVKEARGQGDSRTYPYAYEQVFNATLAAAKTKGLDVVENDKTGGRLMLSHGVTWLSWGERIAVFFKAASPKSTEVEIVSKPVLSPLNFPPDWQQILLQQIDHELRAGK
jgi:hypothetical protein